MSMKGLMVAVVLLGCVAGGTLAIAANSGELRIDHFCGSRGATPCPDDATLRHMERVVDAFPLQCDGASEVRHAKPDYGRPTVFVSNENPIAQTADELAAALDVPTELVTLISQEDLDELPLISQLAPNCLPM